jgi:hypothetical protein
VHGASNSLQQWVDDVIMPIATLGHLQAGLITVATGDGHITMSVAIEDQSTNGRMMSVLHCYYESEAFESLLG